MFNGLRVNFGVKKAIFESFLTKMRPVLLKKVIISSMPWIVLPDVEAFQGFKI